MRRTRTFRGLLAALVVWLSAAGCQTRPDTALEVETSAEDATPGMTEAERTRLMEEKAAAARRDFEEAKANARTEQEAEDAVREYERAVRELNELAEDDGAGDDPPD